MKKSFKTLVAVVCAALTFGLTSCAKDAEDLIIGTWDFVSMEMTMTYGDEDPYVETITPGEGESTTYTFKKDGTFEMIDVTADGTTTGTGTYTVKDNKITMSYTDEDGENTETYDIKSIDKKAMTLNTTESTEWEGETFTMSVTIKLNKK
jgi:hypothetical protein